MSDKETAVFRSRSRSALWLFSIPTILLLTAGVAAEAPGTIAGIADIAREKDVVWLALVAAIVAILFAAWLVRTMLTQWKAAIDAMNALTNELQKRPCWLKKENP